MRSLRVLALGLAVLSGCKRAQEPVAPTEAAANTAVTRREERASAKPAHPATSTLSGTARTATISELSVARASPPRPKHSQAKAPADTPRPRPRAARSAR